MACIWMGVMLFRGMVFAAATPEPEIHRIVLITIDALRADHVSCYGYSHPTTPFLDRLASEGVLFSQAYASASWTVPSMASLFLGLYPRDHGVSHGVVQQQDKKILNQEVLPAAAPTLAEILRAAGYTTFGISANGHLAEGTGFERGFDYFRSIWFAASPAPNRIAQEWRSTIVSATNAFIWIHYFDPHDPYSAREPWLGRYTTNRAVCMQWAGRMTDQLHRELPELHRDASAAAALVDLYDSEINYADEQIADLFKMLALGEDALVIITADHGEEFLDHQGLGHGTTLYEEVVRVPLIIRWPGCPAGRVVRQPVSLVDLPATIVDLLGNKPVMPGTSLKSLMAPASASTSQLPVFLETDRDGYHRAVRLEDWKLITADRNQKRVQLFNLRADPGEKRDCHQDEPETADRLSRVLESWQKQRLEITTPKKPISLSPEEIEKLRSLGYAQ